METQDIKHTSTDAKKANNFDFSTNEITVKSEVIKGTPFVMKWMKDKGWSFGIAEYKLSEYYETREEALEKLGLKELKGGEIVRRTKTGTDYELIVNIVGIMIEKYLKAKDLGLLNEEA